MIRRKSDILVETRSSFGSGGRGTAGGDQSGGRSEGKRGWGKETASPFGKKRTAQIGLMIEPQGGSGSSIF